MKKQLIMEKALELFAKQGFEATSVQQITEHAGISKGAFYLSFKSKDELILSLIDQFLLEFTSNIDYIVKSTENNDQLLYKFYYETFHSFSKHSDFAKVFMKEQAHSVNEEFISKMTHYNRLLEEIIVSMVERIYGTEAKHLKYDIVFCIKAFMKTYSELFLFYSIPLDLKLLSNSLVEKTDLLAKHMKLPFITHELFEMMQQPSEEISAEHLLKLLSHKIEEIDDSIEKESLILLKDELLKPSLKPVIIRGLLENIHHHPNCKKVSFLLRSYFKL